MLGPAWVDFFGRLNEFPISAGNCSVGICSYEPEDYQSFLSESPEIDSPLITEEILELCLTSD